MVRDFVGARFALADVAEAHAFIANQCSEPNVRHLTKRLCRAHVCNGKNR